VARGGAGYLMWWLELGSGSEAAEGGRRGILASELYSIIKIPLNDLQKIKNKNSS
jgi:hypothetical protein